MKLFDDVTRFLINIKRPITDERREILEIEAKDFKEEEELTNLLKSQKPFPTSLKFMHPHQVLSDSV